MNQPGQSKPTERVMFVRENGKKYRKTAPVWAVQMTEPFEVETLEGTMRAEAGDYLCEGPKGERWPIKKEIFESTYELDEDVWP